ESRAAESQTAVEQERAARVESERRISQALQEKIEELVNSQRELQETREQQRLEAERRAAEVAQAQQRIVEAQTVLAEARQQGQHERQQRDALASKLEQLANAVPSTEEHEVEEPLLPSAVDLAEQVAR